MAIKKFKIEASEQAKQLAKKPVKSAAGKKRWGLYSDFGQRILNETFDSKREAQKAFRECGYTKDSEAWIEEVDETAVGKFDKKSANSACGGKTSVRSSDVFSSRGSEVLDNGWVIQKIRSKWYLMAKSEFEKYESNLEQFPKDLMVDSFPSKESLIQAYLREPAYKGMLEKAGYSLDKDWNVVKNRKSVKSSARKTVRTSKRSRSVKAAKDKSNRVSPDIQARIDSLNRLKKVINEYSENEFGDEADFSNLKEVHLAYTVDEYNEDELHVTADLEDFKITYSRYDEYGLNNEYVERYKSWDEMADALDGVTFDLLIADVPEHDEINGACGGKKSKKTVKASAAAKHRAKQRVACSEDGPLCVCDRCLAGIESHEGRQVIYDEIYSDADYGEPPLICDWCGDEVGKLYQITPGERIESAEQPVKASKYYEITDHNNNEIGRSDLEDEARELAKKLLKENDEDYYDIWWVDTDPDSTDDSEYIDTVYADKPFSVEGYYEANFRGLADSDTFYELRDALEYAQELLSKGLSVRMECENAGDRLEITPDEYDEFVQTADGAMFEDMPEVAEWISAVQVERMDSYQEPLLDNWQYNTDIGMSTKAVTADLSSLEEIEEWGTDIPDKTKELGAFNSDTAPYDVNTTVAEYITDNYGIYAESVSYVEYNGPGDWVVDMSQSGQAVADDFVHFLSEKDYDLSLKLYGESETDASGYDMKDYYGDDAIHGNDFQFQFYPAQNQWSAPQVDVDINELIQIGLTQEEANRVVDLVAEYEQNYISICQDINYYIESFLKELSEEEVKASTGVKAALGNKNKTDYASNPIYELDKYVKDLAEGVAAAAGITLTYQVSDEAITFIDGDGTAVFIQPISEITPEPDDLEDDIQQLVSAIQYEDMDNPEYWPTDTSEDDPDYAARAVQMSVDDDLEPVMGEGEDIGFGVDSYGETIDESTVSELYRIAEKEILPNTKLAQIDPYVSIDEDSWDFYFGGVSNTGMMGVVKFYIHFKLTSDNIDLNEYVLPDAKLYPDFKYYKASLDFDIYTENGKVTDVVLESADIYKSDNSYDDHFSGKFGETFNTEAIENYIEKLAAPAAEEIYNAVSNL